MKFMRREEAEGCHEDEFRSISEANVNYSVLRSM